MHRHRLAVAAGLLLALPLTAAAQPDPYYASDRTPAPVPNALFTVTPYFGLRSPLVSQRRATVVLPGLVPVVVDLSGERVGGGIAGAEAELRLFGPIGIVGSFAASNPDGILVTTQTESGALSQVEVDGASVYFARAALSYRFPEPDDPDGLRKYRPAAYIAVGPALVREEYGEGVLSLGDSGDRVDNWALAISLKGVQPLGTPRIALHLGLEDYVTFWNPDDDERRRIEQFLSLQPGTVLNADFDYDETHIIMVHLGISFRL